jgi:hypothetical protein
MKSLAEMKDLYADSRGFDSWSLFKKYYTDLNYTEVPESVYDAISTAFAKQALEDCASKAWDCGTGDGKVIQLLGKETLTNAIDKLR